MGHLTFLQRDSPFLGNFPLSVANTRNLERFVNNPVLHPKRAFVSQAKPVICICQKASILLLARSNNPSSPSKMQVDAYSIVG